MAIRKRGNGWQIDYFDPNGKRVRQSFKKKKDAVAELGKRVSLIEERRYLDVKKDYTTTLKELLDKYTENFQHQPSYVNGKKTYLRNFRDYFGEETKLANIKYVALETYRTKLRETPIRWGTLRTAAAINREMSCLRHVLTKASEWEMIERSPFERGGSLIIKEDNARTRYLLEDEIPVLLKECEHKKHLHWVVQCALNTGMRKEEILSLQWDQIRGGFIYLEKTKTRTKREVPINSDLGQVFKEIRQEQGLSSGYVFTYARRRLHYINRAFTGATRRAGIRDFKFHDLRHTFASHFIMRGGSIKELQEILGHKNVKMTMRYAHLSPAHKKKAINIMNGLTSGKKSQDEATVTKVSHLQINQLEHGHHTPQAF